MRALVVGAKGFVGAALVRELLERGHAVRAVELREGPGRLADVAGEIEWVLGDGSDPEQLRRAAGSDIDGLYYGPFLRGELEAELRVMASGAWSAFLLARELGLRRTVFPSSTAVHGYQPEDSSPVSETTRVLPQPHGLYGAAKLLCEQAGAEVNAAAGRAAVVSVRLPSVYGPGAAVASRRVNVPAVAAARGEPGRVAYAPGARVCIAHVEDVAQLLATAYEAEAPAHAVYEAGGLDVSFGEIAETAAELVPGARTEFGEDERPFLPHAVDWSRAREDLGALHRDLREGMASVVEYEQARLP
jgi:UDP-glucose 4-epimerase